jgi:hypothetical protein
MTKSNTSKTTKITASPDKLSKTGRKFGIELTEAELGQASGGASFIKWNLKI